MLALQSRLRITALAALFMAAGCSSDGYSTGRDLTADQRSAQFPLVADDWSKLGYRLDWKGFPAVTGSLPINFIEPGQDIVVTLEGGSQLSILEATTGRRRATDQLANPLTRFVGLIRDGERIYAVSEAENFTVDIQTGLLRDRKRFEKIVSTEPVKFGNILICGSPSGEVMAHAATGSISGVKTWGFAMGGAVARKPALVGSAVGAVSQNGVVVFLDAETGGLLGRNTIYGGVEVDPVSDANSMYVASTDQSVYAFSPIGGAMLWRYRTSAPLRTQPTAHDGKLYCSVAGQGLVAFDGGTGAVLWQCRDFSNGVVVAMNRGRLVVFNGAEAALIDPARGDVLERVRLNGVSMLKPDVFVDGNLYAASKSGVVAKFLKR
jgi:outer membrane protein assembly factor BamB